MKDVVRGSGLKLRRRMTESYTQNIIITLQSFIIDFIFQSIYLNVLMSSSCPSLWLSWMVISPERGPIRSRLWAALSTHWLTKSSSVFYTSVSPTLTSYQVCCVSCAEGAILPSYCISFQITNCFPSCFSSSDSSSDFQRHRSDRRRLLGQIQNRTSSGETPSISLWPRTRWQVFMLI